MRTRQVLEPTLGDLLNGFDNYLSGSGTTEKTYNTETLNSMFDNLTYDDL